MTQEEFMRLAQAKRELEAFLEFTEDEDFVGIAAHKYVEPIVGNLYREITDKEIVNKIIELVQNELDNINITIDEL